jgi:hypothetical protein
MPEKGTSTPICTPEGYGRGTSLIGSDPTVDLPQNGGIREILPETRGPRYKRLLPFAAFESRSYLP